VPDNGGWGASEKPEYFLESEVMGLYGPKREHWKGVKKQVVSKLRLIHFGLLPNSKKFNQVV
jgi:hypothetical protein